MKRLVSVLIALTVTLMPFAALAAPGDATILRRGVDGFDGGVESMAYAGGTLYMLTYDALYTFGQDDAKAVRREWAEDSFAPQEEGATIDRRSIFADGEDVYLVCTERVWRDDDGDMEMEVLGVTLRRLSLLEDGRAGVEIALELDWEAMVEEEGDYVYVREMRQPFVADGTLYFLTYAQNGMALMAYDLEDGSGEEIELPLEDGDSYISSLCPYTDGKVLLVVSKWTQRQSEITVTAFDLESEEFEELFELPTVGYAYPSSFVYGEALDTLYYVMNGELHTIAGMDISTNQAVASMGAETYSESLPIVTEDGLFISGGYEAVVRRNTDPSQRAETRLVVQNWYNTAVEKAYYDYTNTLGDVEVVMTNQVEDIVQAMMNRSSAVDIYCLSASSAEFDAVFARGYMAEMTESAAVAEIVEKIYPALREYCVKDGEVLALPVELYLQGRGYNAKAFAKVGLSDDDAPSTWVEFFEMLMPLAERLEDYPEVTLFEPYYTVGMVKNELFQYMLQDYMTWIAQPGGEFSFDTPAFRAMMDAYTAVDFDALGLLEDGEDDNRVYEYTEDGTLFNSYYDISARVYALEQNAKPLLLGISDDVEPRAVANLTVVFINPFSENRDMAMEFVEAIAANLDDMLKIHMLPDQNEPVLNQYYESNLKDYDEMIETAKAELEKASDDDRAEYEKRVAEYEEYKREFEEKYMWEATAESIALYREIADSMLVQPYLGIGNDNAEEFYTLMTQFVDGMIDADAFIKGIDGKLQMMMLEGQ